MATAIKARRKTVPESSEIDPKFVKIVHLMDESIRVPGTKLRIGLDGIIGMLPVIGDVATGGMAVWTLREAKRLNLPLRKRLRIGWYYGVDMALGAIPLVGDLFDFGFKANRKSLEVMQAHLNRKRSR